MARTAYLVLIVALTLGATGPAFAQPVFSEGDLIVAGQMPTILMKVDGTTGRWTTITSAQFVSYRDVVMNETNTHLLVASTGSNNKPGDSGVFRVSPSGVITTVLRVGTFESLRGLELDYDGTWLMARYYPSALMAWDGRQSLTTLFSTSDPMNFHDVAIDRDPGGPPFVLCSDGKSVISADRNGMIAPLRTGRAWGPLGIALRPGVGDYLVTGSANSPGRTAVATLSKTGRLTSIVKGPWYAFASRYIQEGNAWVTSSALGVPLPSLELMDETGTIVRSLRLGTYPAILNDVEVYGRRRLYCRGSGRPGTSVVVNLQSRRAGDGGQSYVLACSLARRPGVWFRHGERLDLAQDPLFFLSAASAVPTIFQAFRGTTDPMGNATAQVNIPASTPPGLGITVFVAGIIYDTSGVLTVTNTHWFVLS